MIATATEVKNKFGEYAEKAQREPVIVQKSGRDSVVLLSHEEYQRLLAMEDRYWGERARAAEQSGYLGPDASLTFVQSRLAETEASDE